MSSPDPSDPVTDPSSPRSTVLCQRIRRSSPEAAVTALSNSVMPSTSPRMTWSNPRRADSRSRLGHRDGEPVAAEQVGLVAAEDLAGAPVHKADRAVGGQHDDHRGGDVQVALGPVALLANERLALLERALGALQLGHVHQHALRAHRPAVARRG